MLIQVSKTKSNTKDSEHRNLPVDRFCIIFLPLILAAATDKGQQRDDSERSTVLKNKPSLLPASLRTSFATDMTSGPMPSPGSRVMLYLFELQVVELRIVTHLGEEDKNLEMGLDCSECLKGLIFSCIQAAIVAGGRSNSLRLYYFF